MFQSKLSQVIWEIGTSWKSFNLNSRSISSLIKIKIGYILIQDSKILNWEIYPSVIVDTIIDRTKIRDHFDFDGNKKKKIQGWRWNGFLDFFEYQESAGLIKRSSVINSERLFISGRPINRNRRFIVMKVVRNGWWCPIP